MDLSSDNALAWDSEHAIACIKRAMSEDEITGMVCILMRNDDTCFYTRVIQQGVNAMESVALLESAKLDILTGNDSDD